MAAGSGVWQTCVRAAIRAAWAPVAIFTAHVIASRGLHAYLRYPWLDIPMHLLGGVAIAYFFASSLAALPLEVLPARRRGALIALLVASLTCSTTALWEFAEFISDHLFGTHAQLGLADTLGDMANGLAGGLCYVAIAWVLGSLGRVAPAPASPL